MLPQDVTMCTIFQRPFVNVMPRTPACVMLGCNRGSAMEDEMPNTAPFDYRGEGRGRSRFPWAALVPGSIGSVRRGPLIDWEILNRPAKGITNGLSHFAVKAEQDGKVLDARILNGPYLGNRTGDFPADTSRNFGFGARRNSLVGMPHFSEHVRRPLSGGQPRLQTSGSPARSR